MDIPIDSERTRTMTKREQMAAQRRRAAGVSNPNAPYHHGIIFCKFDEDNLDQLNDDGSPNPIYIANANQDSPFNPINEAFIYCENNGVVITTEDDPELLPNNIDDYEITRFGNFKWISSNETKLNPLHNKENITQYINKCKLLFFYLYFLI